MDKKRMDAQEQEDLLLYLESMLRCVNALRVSVGEVLADVVTMRNAILDDQQDLAMSRSGKHFAAENAKAVDGRVCPETPYADLMMEIASTQQYKN